MKTKASSHGGYGEQRKVARSWVYALANGVHDHIFNLEDDIHGLQQENEFAQVLYEMPGLLEELDAVRGLLYTARDKLNALEKALGSCPACVCGVCDDAGHCPDHCTPCPQCHQTFQCKMDCTCRAWHRDSRREVKCL